MKIKTLQFVLKIEAIVCVYRNFCNYKKITRCVIVLRILVEILQAILNAVIRNYHNLYDDEVELFYFFLSTALSAILLPLVCFNSPKFQKLIKNLEIQHKYFNQNKKLNNLDTKNKLFTCIIGILVMIKLGFLIIYWIQIDLSLPLLDLVVFYFLHLNMYITELRYIYEYMAINCILCLLAEELSRITDSIDAEISYINSDDLQIVKESAASTKHRIKLLDKWSQAYKNVKKSSNIFNSVINFQLSIMLLSIFFFYILLLYSITSLSVSGTFTPAKKFLYACTLLTYLTVIYIVSVAAQRTENNYIALKRRLSTLLLHCVSVPECREATRALLRVVSTRPIRTEAYGSVAVNMSLLPNCIALCTSYTYVALQFNKVI